MPDDLAALRAKAQPSARRRPVRYTPPIPLFPMPSSSQHTARPQVKLPTGERREKVQVSAIAITLAVVTLILGGLIALIIELT